MFDRKLLLLVLLLIFPMPGAAQTEDESPPFLSHLEKPSASPTPVNLYGADALLSKAYRDVFEMLSQPNECSGFYGGSQTAVFVLNKFVVRITKSQLPKDVSFVMKGRIISNSSQGSGMRYRLFESAIVNIRGSFYQTKAFESQPSLPSIGTFPAGTRSARALILLHELGHLIEGQDHNWLIRDDGMESAQSRRNTELVEHACRRKLDSLN